MSYPNPLRLLLVTPLPILFAHAALAVDGVVEINQTRALAGGVTATDTPGFPVTIDTPGSYVLTSNLTTPSISVRGIEVESDGVTIDLNGFTMTGGANCTGFGTAVSCLPSNNADGINSLGFEGATVKNGRMVGWARAVILGDHSRVEGVDASRNANTAIDVSSGSEVRDCQIFGNGGPNSALFVGSGGVAEGNSVRGNLNVGIQTGQGVLIEGNAVTRNGGHGIVGFSGSMITSNAVYWNGDGTNVDNQLQLNSDTGYVLNTIVSNTGNGTVSGGVNLGGNTCNGAALCP